MAEQSVSPTSVVVLAGGQSTRLGRDKSLPGRDGQPLVARTVTTLAALSDDLVVVTNDPERFEALALPVRFVPDEQRGVGALMGLYSGLKASAIPGPWSLPATCPFSICRCCAICFP